VSGDMLRRRLEVEAVIQERWRGPTARRARDFKDALGIGKSLRVRQAEVTALSKTANTATILLGGSSMAGVPYSGNLPVPGYGCWVITDGEDMFIFANHHTAPGDSIKLNRDADQTIGDITEEKISFSDPADNTTNLPQNNAYDYYGAWQSAQPTRLYLPAPGMWTLTAQVEWAGDVDGRRILTIWNANDAVVAKAVTPSQGAAIVVPQTAITQVRATDVSTGGNEYFRINVWHNANNNLVVNGAGIQYSPIFIAVWEGPPGGETIFNS